ncbi:MAG: hypothetical protein JW814_00545 [Candidatus Krumholzibacteriota bacterium]|nr:hypothetical protein [Candidatus Krumholzibacteriota bacterium]
MGFFKRLLGLEVKPGEPVALQDLAGYKKATGSNTPSLVYYFHLWCSSCQVMGGLLNEIGPDYTETIDFYKLDIHKVPEAATAQAVSAVPTLIIFLAGEPVARHSGLIPIDQLREWIEKNISPGIS